MQTSVSKRIAEFVEGVSVVLALSIILVFVSHTVTFSHLQENIFNQYATVHGEPFVSDGKRIEVRAGYHAEESIKSIRGTTDAAFRFAELTSKRSGWFPWFRKQYHSLKILDPTTIEFGERATTTRFVKCSSKNSLL